LTLFTLPDAPKSGILGLRLTSDDRLGEIEAKWLNGPTGADLSLASGIGFGAAAGVSSSPAMNLVNRPSSHDPSLSKPGLAVAFRAERFLAGSIEGEPVNRSIKSSREAVWCEESRAGPFLIALDAVSTAWQYLRIRSALNTI
jgi:hypothetical protein